MTFSRLFQGQVPSADSSVDRLFFTKAAEPQAFRHPLLTHLQHTLHSQLDGGGGGEGALSGKHGLGSDYFYHHPSPHRHWVGKSKHHHHQSHKSNSTAISALTLLTFLFFLNLLQSCLREQMETMNPTVMVMTAGAAREERFEKSAEQAATATADGSEETESFFPEERVHTNNASNYRRRHNQSERSRFQKISVAYADGSTSSSSAKSVLFRTRV